MVGFAGEKHNRNSFIANVSDALPVVFGKATAKQDRQWCGTAVVIVGVIGSFRGLSLRLSQLEASLVRV